MMDRRTVLLSGLGLAAAGGFGLAGCKPAGAPATAGSGAAAATGKSGRTALTLGMVLEPPGLDPTIGAASAIGEITLYNVYETLTRIGPDGQVSPLLAESWEHTPDLLRWTFRLRQGVQFHNGEAFSSETVKFAFLRAAGSGSTNKDKRLFNSFVSVETPDAHTVELVVSEPNPDLPFLLGQATAIMVEPGSEASNGIHPIGTGPYQLDNWRSGASLVLKKWPDYRDAGNIALEQVTFRFISDTAAQAAALLSGDIDLFPRVQVARSLEQFRNNPRFQVLVGGSRAKTILAMNHARKPLHDVRVRRAISAAIDRQAVITGAADGFGVPIGSYYVPGAPGYVDTTGINPYDPDRARALLKEAGVDKLTLTIKLPPPPYARQGGEVIAAMLAKVGITAKLENIEWAQWLSHVYGGSQDYDMTIISHVEPFDLDNLAKPDYYWHYDSPQFQQLYTRITRTADEAERNRLLGEAQQLAANDAVSAYLYQPQWITVARSDIEGLWQDMPVFVNDLAAIRFA